MRLGLLMTAAAVMLAGCAGDLRAVNPDSGIIENATTAGGALSKADAYCAKTNRTARAASFDAIMGVMRFDCVARSGA